MDTDLFAGALDRRRYLNDRTVDVALGATLALLPLLPTGPQYVGLSSSSWAEAVLVILVVIRLLTPNRRPGRGTPAAAAPPNGRILWAIFPFVSAATGALLVAVTTDNVVGSQVFGAFLRDGLRLLYAPIDPADDPLYALRVWLTLIEGPLAFWLVMSICRRARLPRRRAYTAVWGTLVGVALVSVFAVFQYFTRFKLHPYWVRANPDLVRSHATLDDPNALGSYLALGIGLAAGLALQRPTVASDGKRQWTVWLAAFIGGLAIAALITTVSRSAWAATGLAGLFVGAYGPLLTREPAAGRRRPLYPRLARGALVVVAALSLIWLAAHLFVPGRIGPPPASPLQAALATIDPRVPLSETLKGRQRFWNAALRMAATHPVVGVGLGRFPRMAGRYSKGLAPADNTHNFFLQLLAETGIVGLVAFLVPLGIAAVEIRTAARAARTTGGRPGLWWGLALGSLGFLLTLLTGHPLLVSSIQLVLGTAIAAVLIAADTDAPEPQRPFSQRRITILVSAAILVVYAAAFQGTKRERGDDPWGYSWGLFAPEVDPSGRPFRWAGAHAWLYAVPPKDATTLVVTFAAFPPQTNTGTTVTIHAGPQRRDIVCHDGAWHQSRFALGDATPAGLDIGVDVDRVGVPAAVDGSSDVRVLGAKLRLPVFLDPAGQERSERTAAVPETRQ